MRAEKNKLVIVDGHALLFRAYHGMPPLSLPTGESIHATYGFIMIMLNMLREIKPSHLVVTFDTEGPTFRHERYEKYKATRVAPPEDLAPQLLRLKELLDVFKIPYLEMAGYEADDIIGCLTERMPHGFEAIIVTGDLDELQLINDRVKVYTMRRGFTDTIIYDEEKVKERYGFGPELLIEFKALKGDPSDNIPGVPGIGEKTAADLVVKYSTLEKIYENVSTLSPSLSKKLEAGKESAFESRELSRIECDLDFEFDFESARFGLYEEKKVKEALVSLGFKSLVTKVPATGKEEMLEEKEEKIVKRAKVSYELITNKDSLKRTLKDIDREVFIDLFSFEDKLFLTAFIKGKIYICALDETLIGIWAEGLKDKDLVGFNLKQIFRVIPSFEARPKFDLMLAAFLIDANRKNDTLEDLSLMYLGKEIELPSKNAGSEDVLSWAALRAQTLKPLKEHLGKGINKEGLGRIFESIELPLTRVLADVELRGVHIDVKYLNKLSSELEKRIELSREKIYKLAGTEFNISSPIQLKEVLFNKLNLASSELRRSKTGISTAASELYKLRGVHPVIDEIFEYRELTKLKSTYVDALPKLVNVEDGRIHTSYNQTGAATGRLSSSGPNLQNIPIRTELGNSIRNSFMAGEGKQFLAADYSQIELRVAAHLSNDKNFIAAFNKGEDFHANTAAMVYGVSPEKVTKNQRRVAKAVNFGVLYGQGPHGLSEVTGLTFKEAQEYIKKYFELFNGLKTYLDSVRKSAHEKGFAETPMGRRRPIPELKSPNFAIRNAGERMAINMPIQGMAADILKMAMIKLHDELPDAPMILTVHDELVFEIDEGKVKEQAKMIKKTMEGIYKLKVPILVELEFGRRWGELTELNIDA